MENTLLKFDLWVVLLLSVFGSGSLDSESFLFDCFLVLKSGNSEFCVEVCFEWKEIVLFFLLILSLENLLGKRVNLEANLYPSVALMEDFLICFLDWEEM